MTTDPGATLPDIPLGRRVVLRYQLASGFTQPLTDVIGELVSLDPPTVRAADGQVVSVAPERVVALKALGPRPIRTKEIRALETAAAYSWPGVEHAWINGWLVRAGRGYTKRANSAVPLGSPARPLDNAAEPSDSPTGPADSADNFAGPATISAETLHRIGEWYAARGLPAQLALPDRLAPLPPGWDSLQETLVLAMDIGNFVLPQGPSMVRIAQTPDHSWRELYRNDGEVPTAQGNSIPAPVQEVLTAVHEGELGFAALGLPKTIAIGRGALTTASDGRRWIGLTCVTVAAEHRRHGLGSLVCAELVRWGHDRGATHAYLQVAATNSGAVALYRDLGFIEHHSYRYAVPTAVAEPRGMR